MLRAQRESVLSLVVTMMWCFLVILIHSFLVIFRLIS